MYQLRGKRESGVPQKLKNQTMEVGSLLKEQRDGICGLFPLILNEFTPITTNLTHNEPKVQTCKNGF